MIQIKFDCSKGFLTGFHMKGHADFAEAGKDIVCAAASIYSINTINSIEYLVGIEDSIYYDAEDGKIDFGILTEKLSGKEKEQTELLMRSMELAFISLRDEYNKYIKIYYEEV